jgi:pilus assembly protein CpaB
MNPRQRRGLLLLILAAVGAITVFFAISSYVSDVRSQVEPLITVLRLKADAEPYSPIDESELEEFELPRRWAPETALRDRSELIGQVPASQLETGSILQRGMLVPEPSLEPGQRELAILIDAETGVAGKVGSGDIVDIVASFEGDEAVAPKSQIVVAGARVIDVGVQRTREVPGPDPQEEEVIPVTFALSVQESLILTYAESFAAEVRLALVRPGETEPVPPKQREYELGAE